jgi:4-hydroxybenzoate polyprenyltransferase
MAFLPVAAALPFTFFYLIPVHPGGPRLRDLPYLKVIWVALAWTLMTDAFLVGPHWLSWVETPVRFLFTLSIALLFDTRDVVLDRRQGVRTLAAHYPILNRWLAMGLLLACALSSFFVYSPGLGSSLAVGYLAAAAIGIRTDAARGEDFYATYVNGALLLPPLCLLVYHFLFAAY